LSITPNHGIVNHSKSRSGVLGDDWGEVNTLEGEIVKLADIVAYINHDIGDAIRAGVITEGSLPLVAVTVLGLSHSARINTMVTDIIEFSWAARGPHKPGIRPRIGMSPNILSATEKLREFLFDKVYNMQSAQKESEKARLIIHKLYDYFCDNIEKLPPEYRRYSEENQRRVVDYIAGMTDQYALRIAEDMALLDKKVKQASFIINKEE